MSSTRNEVVIPIDPEIKHRLLHHCARLGLTVKNTRNKSEYRVSFTDPLDLYWLGANIGMQPFNNGVSQHI